jgi:hypothetical protein
MFAFEFPTGTAVSGQYSGGSLIRINPDPVAAAVPPGTGVALRAGALAALTAIDARLRYSKPPPKPRRRFG